MPSYEKIDNLRNLVTLGCFIVKSLKMKERKIKELEVTEHWESRWLKNVHKMVKIPNNNIYRAETRCRQRFKKNVLGRKKEEEERRKK